MLRLPPARMKIRMSSISAEPNNAAIARMWNDCTVGITQKCTCSHRLNGVAESHSENSVNCVPRSHSVNAYKVSLKDISASLPSPMEGAVHAACPVPPVFGKPPAFPPAQNLPACSEAELSGQPSLSRTKAMNGSGGRSHLTRFWSLGRDSDASGRYSGCGCNIGCGRGARRAGAGRHGAGRLVDDQPRSRLDPLFAAGPNKPDQRNPAQAGVELSAQDVHHGGA